ncbi:EamA family transporter [Marinobacter sp. BGYM27]|uniref:EamA family transporter n=1 Tax=Marinobacter sp. BGYM27 TaxID=2975597 RepID=UPI0021A449A1|nr:EamA family transporter [Marinobacter sp. BGYM27]MDG5499625.1 EamA family transporter [Marinobacter sp. BGYM27]
MDPWVVGLVLVAAVLHAGWNALVKSGGAPFVRLAITNGFAAIVMLAPALYLGFPDAESWPFLFGSMLVHLAYYLLLAYGYRLADLSLVYPVARGSAPPLVALGAFFVAGERLTTWGAVSIAVVSLAIGLLAFRAPEDKGTGRSVLVALAIGALIAAYSVLDGMGARLSTNTFAYIAWMFVLDGLVLLVWGGVWQGRQIAGYCRDHWQQGLASGVMYMTAYGLVVWAMTKLPMTYVSALRETSVIMAALIGARYLNEPFGGRRIVSACLVAVGVVMLQFSHS